MYFLVNAESVFSPSKLLLVKNGGGADLPPYHVFKYTSVYTLYILIQAPIFLTIPHFE